MDREAGGSKGGKGKANESTTFVYLFLLGDTFTFQRGRVILFQFFESVLA